MIEKNKPIIETLINTTALSLTSWGVLQITKDNNWIGALGISFGVLLEYIKYLGRQKKLW